MFSSQVGQCHLLLVKMHKGCLIEAVVLFIYFLPAFQRTANEKHVHLPCLFLFLSDPCIINHTLGALRAHLSASPFSILPKFSARASSILSRTYMGDKRPKIWKFMLIITHLSRHLPSGQSSKGRALTRAVLGGWRRSLLM